MQKRNGVDARCERSDVEICRFGGLEASYMRADVEVLSYGGMER